MRKLILVVACLSLFLAGWCFGQENVLNGTLWKSLTSVEKLLFVTGFDKGRTVGMNEGINKALDVVVAVKPSWTAEEKRKLVEKAKQIDQKSNANSDVTRSQLLTTVSTFMMTTGICPFAWVMLFSFPLYP